MRMKKSIPTGNKTCKTRTIRAHLIEHISKKQIEEIDATKLQPDSQFAKYSQNKHVIDNKLEGDDTDWTFLVHPITNNPYCLSHS